MLLLSLEDVVRALSVNYWSIGKPNEAREAFLLGETYCSRCGANRRMHANCLYCDSTMLRPDGLPLPPDIQRQIEDQPRALDPHVIASLVPSLFRLRCGECDAISTLLIYSGSTGPSLAILPSVDGGLATPRTPRGVRYYLDQAARCHSAGANSAAVAMFRAALDFRLFEQNYRDRMLGNKLDHLEHDLAAGKAPKWALDLDPEFLNVIKELGNSAIHPDTDDIAKQNVLDTILYVDVAQSFQEMLDVVYEAPQRKQDRLGKLRSAAKSLKT